MAFSTGWANNGFWARPEAPLARPTDWEDYWFELRRAQQAGALEDPVVKQFFDYWQQQPGDPRRASFARQAVLQWQTNRARTPFEEPKPDQIMKGEILIGSTLGGSPVRISKEQSVCHTAFLAGTGSGKTVYCRNLITNNIDAFDAVWIFDLMSKDNWRGALRPLKNAGKQLAIVPWAKARLNLLNPSDKLTLAEVAGDIVDDLSQAFDIKSHSRQYLRAALHASKNITTKDLLGQLEKSEYRYSDALVEKLEALSNTLPQFVRGWPMHTLMTKSILWELAGLDAEIQTFLMCRLIRAAFRESTRTARRGSLLVVVDEANRTFPQGSPLAEMCSIVRAAGLSFVLCFQSLTGDNKISSLVVDNAAVRLLGRVGGVDSLESFARGIGLSTDQTRWARKNLAPGRIVACHPGWHEPFVLTYPNLDFHEPSDAEVAASRAELEFIPVEAHAPSSPRAQATSSAGSQTLGERDRAFLAALCEQPFQNATAFYKQLGYATKSAVEIKDRLCALGYVKDYEDRLTWNGKGRPKHYLEPLAKAFEAISRERTSWGRGGFAHALYLRLIGQQLQAAGYTVTFERTLNGKFLDLHAKNAESELGVELELSERHASENLEKALDPSLAALFVVAPAEILTNIDKTTREHRARKTGKVSLVALDVAANDGIDWEAR